MTNGKNPKKPKNQKHSIDTDRSGNYMCVYTHIHTHTHVIPLVTLKLPGRIPKKVLKVVNSGILLSILKHFLQ